MLVCSRQGRKKRTSPTSEGDVSLLSCGQRGQTHTIVRSGMLKLFGRGPEILFEALHRCPKKMWFYCPADGRWSIHEIILHLTDNEAEAYVHCRQFIAEPGSIASTLDAPRWATMLGYFHQSTGDALGLILRLRRMTYKILQYIPDPVWQHTVKDPHRGMMTLDEWLGVQAQHIPHHVEQIRLNYVEWRKQGIRQNHVKWKKQRSRPHQRRHKASHSTVASKEIDIDSVQNAVF